MNTFNILQALSRSGDLTVMDQLDVEMGHLRSAHLRTARAGFLRGLGIYTTATPILVVSNAPKPLVLWSGGSAAFTMAGYVAATALESRGFARLARELERSERFRSAAVLTALRAELLFTLPNSRNRAIGALFEAVRLAATADAAELCSELDVCCVRALAQRPLMIRPSLERAFRRTASIVGRLPDARRRGMARLVLIHSGAAMQSRATNALRLDAARDYLCLAGEIGTDWLGPGGTTVRLFAEQRHLVDGPNVNAALAQADELLRTGLTSIYRNDGPVAADHAVRTLVATEPARFVLDCYVDVLTQCQDVRTPVFRQLVASTSDPTYVAALGALHSPPTTNSARPPRSGMGYGRMP